MDNLYHFIGIGGIGMSALAKILCEQGFLVQGSDSKESSITKSLEALGVKLFYGHSKEHIVPGSIVVVSSGIAKENPELCAAYEKGCKILHRSDLLHALMGQKIGLAVTGTHGKTSTSTLLAHTLECAGLKPSFALGGISENFMTNGRHETGIHFVAEADESDGTFLKYEPHGAIVTNIGLDHMDHFKDEAGLIDSFKVFCNKSKILVWNGDDERLKTMQLHGISCGVNPGCQFRLVSREQKGWRQFLTISHKETLFADIELSLIGEHQAKNALAVFALATELGLSESAIRQGFKTFKGAHRRCQYRAEYNGADLYDDYAHHPTEIQTTLHAIRQAEPDKRLVAVFQPHRYSRTRDCLHLFASAFHDADLLVVTDIYSAGEKPIEGVDVKRVVSALQRSYPNPVIYLPRENLAEKVANLVKPNDLVVTVGAGDITHLHQEIIENRNVLC